MHPIQIAHQQGVKLNAKTIEALVAALAAEEAPILILDPWSALFDGDENETREGAAMVDNLRKLQRSNPRLLLIIVHHESKAGARGEGPRIYAARGSSTYSGWADTQLSLDAAAEPPNSGKVSFFIEVTKQRDVEKAPRHKLTLTLGEGVCTLTECTAVARDDRSKAIVEALEGEPNGLTRNAIFKAIGGSRPAVLKDINKLILFGPLELTDDAERVRLRKKPTETDGESAAPRSSKAPRSQLRARRKKTATQRPTEPEAAP